MWWCQQVFGYYLQLHRQPTSIRWDEFRYGWATCHFKFLNWVAIIINSAGLSHYKLWVETDTNRADTVYFQIQFDAPVMDIKVNDLLLGESCSWHLNNLCIAVTLRWLVGENICTTSGRNLCWHWIRSSEHKSCRIFCSVWPRIFNSLHWGYPMWPLWQKKLELGLFLLCDGKFG